ncbi:M20/M25/M40 family metallo-hydrolase [Kordiimonas lacus]|uniref:Carboxypeptidase Q n=1 Tax=Kordiimonas lacus TaxID=637679 RepID=A0A1G7C219_9PROT|nr:M20/M25/M40 family metallo-hydrolase [Kordiimonas lacus]SDE33347.1 Peptidase family M28 [Kordiimonas lacus]
MIKKSILAASVAIGISGLWGGAWADDAPDLEVISKIRDEGFNHSQVMKTLHHLTDRIGPRLTGSPAMTQANEWTRDQLTAWGLENARLEGFDFGPGWTWESVDVRMTAPRTDQLYALPISWYPGTDGPVTGEVVFAPMKSKADFEKYKGKLKGKIVLVDAVRPYKDPTELNAEDRRHANESILRYTEGELEDVSAYDVPEGAPGDDSWVSYKSWGYYLTDFLEAEAAAAIVRRSPRRNLLIDATGYQYLEGELPSIPAVRMASEHYDRAVRLLNEDLPVSLSLEVKARYHTDDMQSYSTLADIPGQGRRPELVMLGAHLDSWFMGDGAVDNGAGVAVTMEAVRILKAIGIKPKRTIRIGLWGGEEQGYYGSYQYVKNHLATRPAREDEKLKYMEPYAREFGMFPIAKKPEFDRFSAYFNLDNGSGKIRGVYAEGNAAAAAIFKTWLEPFHDLGADTVTMNDTGGTDHEVFDDIGLPGFQFIQDPLDYDSRLHHSTADTYDHAFEKDLKQAAVIMASFVYNAAMRDERFPREPEPREREEDLKKDEADE